LITASSNGYLYVLDPDSGRILWSYLPGFGVSSEIVKAEDGIYFLTNSAMLFKMVRSSGQPSAF
jgi:outer membrane protein assembly factor BamB